MVQLNPASRERLLRKDAEVPPAAIPGPTDTKAFGLSTTFGVDADTFRPGSP